MRRCLTLALVLGATAGCEPDLDRVELTAVTSPPLEHTVSGDGVVLTQGTAIAVQVQAFDEDGERTTAEVSLLPEGTGLRSLILDHDANRGTRYVLIADEPGVGQLVVFELAGSRGQVTLPFLVDAQTAP